MHSSSPLAKLAICVASFFLFVVSFNINAQFDSLTLYTTGISLVFIPAGFKLLCLLVGGEAAALGLLLSSVYMSMGVWSDTKILQMIYFAFAGVGSYYVSVLLVKKTWNIDETLSNLRYLHIIILSAVASIANGIIHNMVYVWQDKVKFEDFFEKSAAMILGDFLGCFIVIMFFNVCIDLAFKLTDKKSNADKKGVHFIAHLLKQNRS